MPEEQELPGTVTFEVDFSNIPVKPSTAREVRELEVALMIGSIFRPDVMRGFSDPNEFTTWIDSLAVAAGALAREKAGYPVKKIADELGRTEATIRKHLAGETKAGQIVKETYEMLVKGKLKLAVPSALGASMAGCEERLKELEKEKAKLEEKLAHVRESLVKLAEQLKA